MKKHILLLAVSLLLLIYSVSSNNKNADVDSLILTIPGSNCEFFTTSDRKLLDYALLKKKCRSIHTRKMLKIKLNFDGIKFDLFEKLSHLESLTASFSNFTEISLSTSNLRTIDFSRNKLKKFKLSVLENLKSLDVSYNELMTIDLSPVEKETSKLKILDFSHNNLRKIDAISKFQNLEYVDLSWNQIEDVPEFTFTKTEKLIVLNLAFNHISHFRGCPFCFTKDLKFLDLSYNNLKTIDDALLPLRNLRILDTIGMPHISFHEYVGIMLTHQDLREIRKNDGVWKCAKDPGEEMQNDESVCYISQNTTFCCSPSNKNRRKRSAPSNSHFHATVNAKKMFHNVSSILPSNKTTETNGEISLKDFFRKLHELNVENLKTFLKLTLDRIDSTESRLEQKYASILKKIDNDSSVVNKKLTELNSTLSDMVLELSNMDSENGDMLNVTLNEIIPRTSYIEDDYDDILYLLKLCIFLLLVAIMLMIFRIVMRCRRSRALKKYKMNLLNMETIEHR